MSRFRLVLTFLVVGAMALALGIVVEQWRAPVQEGEGAVAADGPDLLAASLPDLAGKVQPLAQWRGKIVVVNFWATWCAPCQQEIPDFMQVQTVLAGQGVQILGIAADDPDKVRPYAAQMKINYPVLVGEIEAMDIARQAGNVMGGLPFTVILDRKGRVVKSHVGRLTRGKLEALVKPLI